MSVVVTNLTKKYGNQKAVDNVSFSIKQGEVVGFLGPNGAGKTTTMKMLTCYIPATTGKIHINGLDTETNEEEVKRNIGYLPEHNPLYLSMYVREYLNFIAGLHDIKNVKSRVDEMIELTGLTKEQTKKISSLSKGYRQRVGLAQAMIHDPKVLILDEPTSGLDPNQLAEIRNVIREMKKEKTVIFSTHIMQEIQAVCDRVLIIDNGSLIADDKIELLHSQDVNIKTIEIKFYKTINPMAFNSIKGIQNLELLSEKSLKMYVESRDDVYKDIFYKAVALDNPIKSMITKEETVEEIFQKLTKK